jgi:hypothetical protein
MERTAMRNNPESELEISILLLQKLTEVDMPSAIMYSSS